MPPLGKKLGKEQGTETINIVKAETDRTIPQMSFLIYPRTPADLHKYKFKSQLHKITEILSRLFNFSLLNVDNNLFHLFFSVLDIVYLV